MKKTFEEVAKILSESKGIALEQIKEESTFSDLGLDSLDTMDLLMTFEEKFSVTLEFNAEIKTVADLVKFIEESKK